MLQITRLERIRLCVLAVFAGASIVASQWPVAAEQAPAVVLSGGVAKPLKTAQEQIRRRNWSAALDDIKQAQMAPNKTAKDEYCIDDLLAYVLYRQNNYPQSVVVYERLLESPLMPADQIEERTRAIAEMHFRLGNYPKAAKWAKRYLERHPDQSEIAEILGDSYFRMGFYQDAAATMTDAVARAERANRVPKESSLRIIEDAYFRLSDMSGMKGVLLKLIRYYQKIEDWNELINLDSQDVRDERVALGYHRLAFDLNLLRRPDDYESMVFEALNALVPAEALEVLDQGAKSGVFAGPNHIPGDYERLLKIVREQTASSRDSLAHLAAKAEAGITGQDDVLVGQMYLSFGQYEQAIEALKAGISKGGVGDLNEAQISIGIAYLRQGNKELANQAFRAVVRDSKWGTLAELWTLRMDDTGRGK